MVDKVVFGEWMLRAREKYFLFTPKIFSQTGALPPSPRDFGAIGRYIDGKRKAIVLGTIAEARANLLLHSRQTADGVRKPFNRLVLIVNSRFFCLASQELTDPKCISDGKNPNSSHHEEK